VRRSQIALVLAGLLALAGGGTALAGKAGGGHRSMPFGAVPFRGGDHGPGDDIEAAAGYLGLSATNLLNQLRGGKTLADIASSTSGKSTAGLIDALVAHEKAELADAVKAGKLTQAQADTISSALTQRVTDFVNGKRPAFAPGPGFGFGHHGPGADFEAAASYLGLSATDLFNQLRSGKTLADIASSTSGKSTAGLIDALVAHEKAELADAVKAGTLTQAQADTISSALTQRVTDFVNGKRPAFVPGPGFGFGFGHHGPGDDIQAAADYLGTTPAALLTQLISGKSLTAIANATSGKSADGLVAALVAHEKTELADAVSAGRITQSEADTIAATLTQRITTLVNGTFPQRGGPHRGLFFPHGRRI
jgi:predicted RNA-binding protein associated with RNAse of E/G family